MVKKKPRAPGTARMPSVRTDQGKRRLEAAVRTLTAYKAEIVAVANRSYLAERHGMQPSISLDGWIRIVEDLAR